MSFFEFPNTRNYDSDLGWLIKSMTQLIDEYNGIITDIQTNTADINSLKSRVTALENSWHTLEEELEAYKTYMNSYVYALVNSLMSQIYDSINQLAGMVTTITAEMVRLSQSLTGLIQATDENNRAWTELKIQEIIDSFPELQTVYVYNPVKGYITDVGEAVMDLYELSRVGALTALQYDMVGLTASEYDALQLTAWEYDNYGLEYIWKNPAHFMYDPFTGTVQSLQYVITELIDLHRSDALTATEYDALALDATYYDNLEVSAYNYDFYGHTYVA